MMKKVIRILLVAFIVFVAVNIAISTFALKTTRFTVNSWSLPSAFEGFRIAQISDLHNMSFGKDNSRLIKKVKAENPDIIVLTGDLMDDKTRDFDKLERLFEELSDIAPCYYVTGNHEAEVYKEYFSFEKRIRGKVKTLHTNSSAIERNGETIYIQGIDDPNFTPVFYDDLTKLGEKEGYKVLLSHRPEKFKQYVENGFDVVFSGHTHGGQIRLPFFGAVVAPSQGINPEYDSGLYTEGDTSMIISRGLGSSVVPFRFFNRPEIVIAELSAER
jgi:predicted MPP superfamily phosphohydrolase